MKNPKWHRDEIILALDLYFDEERGSIDSKNPKIVRLSEILNTLPIFQERPDEEKFRNPNGVSLKLSNFQAIDPNYSGKGMQAYSKLDEEIFLEFQDKRTELKKIANAIKKVVENETLRPKLYAIPDEDETIYTSVREGQVLYKLHRYKERNVKIVTLKKNAVLKATGKLACEACGFDFFEKYGELGKGFIECHHIKPLATYDADSKTSVDDLALVCSNCHRMLHRGIGLLKIEDIANKLIGKSQAIDSDKI